ncbi:MAG: tetratricopeptide repeat protein [Chitinophagales bacterium]|nr:tetratricopeptide repeat protein [Chitinophagales bacterium]
MKSLAACFFVLLIALVGCKPSKEESLKKIAVAEDTVNANFKNSVPEEKVVLNAIKAYEDFAKYYPEDSMAPHYLIKGGDYYRFLKQYDKALNLYEKVEKEFPESLAAIYGLFLQGYTLDEMGQFDKAKVKYETFLRKYPQHELAEAARQSILKLGLSPEEILKQIKAKELADSLSASGDSMIKTSPEN